VIKFSEMWSVLDEESNLAIILGNVRMLLVGLSRNITLGLSEGDRVNNRLPVNTDDLQIAFGNFIKEANRDLPSILFYNDNFSPTERPWYIPELWDNQLPNK
jgi:hypothetical protein